MVTGVAVEQAQETGDLESRWYLPCALYTILLLEFFFLTI